MAEVLPGNRDMLGVFEAVGFEVTRELQGGELEVRFPIAPTERFESRVAERDHTAVTASLRPFFEPRSVAVVGASRRRGSLGGELFRNILEGDFAGAAYPVNRDGEPVAGVRAYRSIAEILETIDVAVVSLPALRCWRLPSRRSAPVPVPLVVISAGFAEIGSEGVERQEQLLALVRSHGARLIGPNCLGIATAGPSLNATFAARPAPAGNIGFSSQSGALGVALLEAAGVAWPRALGVRVDRQQGRRLDQRPARVVGGRRVDGARPDVRRVLRQSATVRPPRTPCRPPQADPGLKSGTSASGRRAASSHTAALAGSETAVDALFHQAG